MRNLRQVAVVGVTGYTGLELARILLRHPALQSPVFYVRETNGAKCLAELFPQFCGWGEAPLRPLSLDAITSSNAGSAFLATPHDVSAELAPALLNAGLRVVDLSGAFRFREAETFTSWYKFPAPHAEWLSGAVFERDRQGSLGCESRLLRRQRDSCPAASYPSWLACSRRQRRLRLQVRRQRRWQRPSP